MARTKRPSKSKVADALEMDDAVLWGPILEHECLPNPEESFTPGPHIIWEAIEQKFDQRLLNAERPRGGS